MDVENCWNVKDWLNWHNKVIEFTGYNYTDNYQYYVYGANHMTLTCDIQEYL